MKNFILYFLQIPNIEKPTDLTDANKVLSYVLWIMLVFICAIVYYHKTEIAKRDSKETDLQDKIDAIYKEHKTDLKDANEDYKSLSEKFYQFTQQIEKLVSK
tara:strand:+ start:112 stop:417 length:306 start_codon:yes stop_codon:yes gene_type:complete